MAKAKRNRHRQQKRSATLNRLRAKWRLERFDPKRHNARMRTITAMIGLVVLLAFAATSILGVGIYEPIEREDAVVRSVEFDYYSRYRSYKGRSDHYLDLTDGERVRFSYASDEAVASLKALPAGTVLELRSHPNGTLLEIRAGEREILNFDYSQSRNRSRSIFFFVLGILAFLGAIPCAVYAWKKVVRERVFSSPRRAIRAKRKDGA